VPLTRHKTWGNRSPGVARKKPLAPPATFRRRFAAQFTWIV
jgi:hypothetical protein